MMKQDRLYACKIQTKKDDEVGVSLSFTVDTYEGLESYEGNEEKIESSKFIVSVMKDDDRGMNIYPTPGADESLKCIIRKVIGYIQNSARLNKVSPAFINDYLVFKDVIIKVV